MPGRVPAATRVHRITRHEYHSPTPPVRARLDAEGFEYGCSTALHYPPCHHNLHPFQPRHYRTMHNIRELSDMALTLAESGQYEKALELVSEEIKIDANNANVWYNQGILLFKMGRYLDARNSFAQAADIDPGFAEAWYNKGIALMNLRKYLDAIHNFNKVIAINPDNHEARQQRDLAQKKIMESCSFSPTSSGKQTKLFK